MPRRKHWRKSDSKRRERSRTDESETTVTGKYTGSPEQLLRQGSPGRNQAGSPGRNQAESPGRNQAGSPERMPAKSPEKKQADLEKPVHSNKSDKLVQKEKVHSKNEEFQCSDFLSLLQQVIARTHRHLLMQSFFFLMNIFFFLMNIFFALKGSKLFIIICCHCSWMLCRVAAVKSLPALIYSADYILLLVL